jgi:hypothetical protein
VDVVMDVEENSRRMLSSLAKQERLDSRAELRGCVCLYTSCSWAEAHLRIKWHCTSHLALAFWRQLHGLFCCGRPYALTSLAS